MARNTRTLALSPSSLAVMSRRASIEASRFFFRLSCRRVKPEITLLEAVTCSWAFFSWARLSSRLFWAWSSRCFPALAGGGGDIQVFHDWALGGVNQNLAFR
jgi:hypothetical protein